jgi:hypothetical protein
MGVVRGTYNILVGKPEGKRPLGRPGIDGKIALRWILGKQVLGIWIGLIWLRIGIGGEIL